MNRQQATAGQVSNRTAYRLLMAIFLGCPFLWGINQPVTILFIQILSLPLIWLAITSRSGVMQNYLSLVLLSGILLALILLQLVPLPSSIWQELPGREVFEAVFLSLPDSLKTNWRAASIVPQETEKALLFVLPSVAIFLVSLLLDKELLTRLMLAVIIVALCQSVLGLIQYGGGIELVQDILYTGSARGTYLNRDHLASFLVMVFPVILAMLASMLGYRSHRQNGAGLRQRWQFYATLEGNQALLYAVVAILVILCLIFTRSRAGIALLMIGLLLSLFAFSYRLGRSNIYGAYGSLIAIIAVVALEIGLTPVLDRFSVDPMQDLRWEIYSISLRIIGDYFPLGSGMGTFSSVYAAYQTPDLDRFINHAHNDYLQWTLEGGLALLLLIVFFLYRYAIHWRYVWIRAEWGGFRFIQVGAGIGILLVALHSLLDFPLHKPANSIYFAFFLAIFFKRNEQGRHHDHSSIAGRP